MEIDVDAIREDLKETYERELENLQFNLDDSHTREIIVLEENNNQRIVDLQSPHIAISDIDNSEFEHSMELAKDFVENERVPLPDRIFSFNDSGPQNYPNVLSEPDKEQIINEVGSDIIFGLVKAVHAEGDFDLSDTSFDIAFKYFRQYLLELPVEFKIIAPLVNFSHRENSLDLDVSNLEGTQKNDLHKEEIHSIKIEPLTKEEKSSIYTVSHQSNFVDGGISSSELDMAVKINLTGYHYLSHRYLLWSVTNGLRLFSPEKPEISVTRSFDLLEGPCYNRSGVYDYLGSSPQEFTLTFPRPAKKYQMSEENAEEFSSFWSDFSPYFKENEEHPFAGAIRRYNQTYVKNSIEDEIIDTSIGIESTLLKDLGTQSSITFRMALRSGILLRDQDYLTKREIHNLTKALYFARGEVVHSNKTISEIMKSEKFNFDLDRDDDFLDALSPRESDKIRPYLRILLSQVIIGYMREYVENSKSITQVNQDIDKKFLDF